MSAAGSPGKGRSRRPEIRHRPRERQRLAAIGLEAEFAVVMDGVQVEPEKVFVTPTRIVRDPMVHRTGRSYHLPTGGAVYFDTGVIEIATPMVELAPGCAAQAGRILWENILYLRRELDAWELREGKEVHLAGFSTHYNISFDVPKQDQTPSRTVHKLAYLLTHVLAFPVMLLAGNRRSTGVGVRPRGNRIEITADFTPDPELMIAAATLIVAATRAVMAWPSYELGELARHGIPVVRGFVPAKHSSRQGWVARYSCFDRNPFVTDVDDAVWHTTAGETLSAREMAERTIARFRPAIESLGDHRSVRLIESVLSGEKLSLLELEDRPPSYEHVGKLCTWDIGSFPERDLPRSRYERVVRHAIAGDTLRMEADRYKATGMQGWSRVVFRRERDGRRRIFSLDQLIPHLRGWAKGT
ncbi:MAG TPA: hypothetical protein VFT96_13690 [Gemmatimonadaceae bacterium]|nr:hypothetical protein [Gemmatimonadaceae bacterium]